MAKDNDLIDTTSENIAPLERVGFIEGIELTEEIASNDNNQIRFHPFTTIFPLMEGNDFQALVDDIKANGLLEPIVLYQDQILDGRNRFRACEAAGVEPRFVTFTGDDSAAFAVVISSNVMRRHLDAGQRALLAVKIEKTEAKLAEQRMLAGKKLDPEQKIAGGQARDKAAKAVGVNRQYVSDAKKISNADPAVANLVQDGTINLGEGKKLIALPAEARSAAIDAVNNGVDVRTAVRDAKKEDYNARIGVAKPRPLEGTYRIFYADPAWKYQADECGAERHYDCLTDQQLCDYRPGDGTRTVKELADENAVLFIWVTAPMSERCFPIIRAWGFEFKAEFIWDKIGHVMGHYNSVRHEKLLICTRGSCLPDTGKLIDSVQTIERTKHSKKPDEFYDIIDAMYSYGRKLELFARKPRVGWDSDGNEIHEEEKVANDNVIPAVDLNKACAALATVA